MAQRSLFNEKRIIKYNYVLAATGSVKLARASRSWSVKRINQAYNVNVRFDDRYAKAVARKVPKTDIAKKRRYNAFVRGKVFDVGVKPLKRKKANRVPRGVRYDKAEFIPIPVPVEKDKKIRETPLAKAIREANELYNFKHRKETKPDKVTNWIDWTKAKLFPADVMEVIEYANKSNNRTIDDSYGYAIAHLMYVENISFEDANKIIIPDRLEVDVYTRVGKIF